MTTDEGIAQVARGQEGIITLEQLRELGLRDHEIKYRLRVGRLRRIHRGIYAPGHEALGFRGRCLAAELALGPLTAVSHRHAAALWHWVSEPKGPVHVTVPRAVASRRAIKVHVTGAWFEEDLAERDGIVLTSPARTVLDCCGDPNVRDPRAIMRQAEVQRKVTVSQLTRILELHPKAPGAGVLQRLLEMGARPTRSQREDDWVDLVRAMGIEPEVNAKVNGHEVDLFIPERNLAVEIDSKRWHDTPTARLLDEEKQRALEALGIRVLRVRRPPGRAPEAA